MISDLSRVQPVWPASSKVRPVKRHAMHALPVVPKVVPVKLVVSIAIPVTIRVTWVNPHVYNVQRVKHKNPPVLPLVSIVEQDFIPRLLALCRAPLVHSVKHPRLHRQLHVSIVKLASLRILLIWLNVFPVLRVASWMQRVRLLALNVMLVMRIHNPVERLVISVLPDDINSLKANRVVITVLSRRTARMVMIPVKPNVRAVSWVDIRTQKEKRPAHIVVRANILKRPV